jgi:hypothetical protein
VRSALSLGNIGLHCEPRKARRGALKNSDCRGPLSRDSVGYLRLRVLWAADEPDLVSSQNLTSQAAHLPARWLTRGIALPGIRYYHLVEKVRLYDPARKPS